MILLEGGSNQGWQGRCDALFSLALMQIRLTIQCSYYDDTEFEIWFWFFLLCLLCFWVHIEIDSWISLYEEEIKVDKESLVLCLYFHQCRGVWRCSMVILIIHNSIYDPETSNGAFLEFNSVLNFIYKSTYNRKQSMVTRKMWFFFLLVLLKRRLMM